MSRSERVAIRMSEEEKKSYELNKASIAILFLPEKKRDGEIVNDAVKYYLEKLEFEEKY